MGSRGGLGPGLLAVSTWANIGASFNTPAPTPVRVSVLSLQPLLPGAEHQVQALLSRYGPGKLYQVTSNISGSGTLDLTLPRGHVVALLQDKDTKGNSSRWLVDTGGMWDFMGTSPPFGKTVQQEPVGRHGHSCGQGSKSRMGMNTGEHGGHGVQLA